MGFEENEISKNAFGGTEIAKRMLSKLIDPELLSNFQIISSRIRDLEEDKIRIFWANDLAHDPEVEPLKDANFRNKFHSMVFISNWQYQQYQNHFNIPASTKHNVIESGFEPIQVDDDKFKRHTAISMCYTSTPQRGLDILIPVFEKLQEKYKDIYLNVFSSFKIYGWDEHDKNFESLYERCRQNSNVIYHGFTPHDELIEYLGNFAHIFAYPCTWQETQCRALIEAMSAKLLCVHPNIAALPETSGCLNLMYQYDADKNIHAGIFLAAMEQAIQVYQGRNEAYYAKLNFDKGFVDLRYGIDTKIKPQWQMLLESLLKQYPTIESRKFKSEMFIYRQ